MILNVLMGVFALPAIALSFIVSPWRVNQKKAANPLWFLVGFAYIGLYWLVFSYWLHGF